MTCVHKEYEVKINMVQEQWQLKVFAPKKKFFLSYNMKIVIYWGSLLVGENSKFSASWGGDLPPYSQ